LNALEIVSLFWFVPKMKLNVLQSTFLNRGWFAEYIVIAIPFFLLSFLNGKGRLSWKAFIFLLLLLCQISIFLTGARTALIVYPIVLLVAVILYKVLRKESVWFRNIRFRIVIKTVIALFLAVVLSIILVFQLIPYDRHKSDDPETYINIKKEANTGIKGRFFKARKTHLFQTGRFNTWGNAITIGRENPLIGLGYESYAWHESILRSIPGMSYEKMQNILNKVRDTAHNFYLQLFVSGGLVGFALWVLLTGYIVVLLFFDSRQNHAVMNICVISSVAGFHLYGIAQSMQYIPMIWCLIFINIGYAMAINPAVLSSGHRGFWDIMSKICIVIALLSGFLYLPGLDFKELSEKRNQGIYAFDQNRDDYLGFYRLEKWPNGYYRWAGRKGLLTIHRSGLIGVNLVCSTPKVEMNPVLLSISVDGGKAETITFNRKGIVERKYYLHDRNIESYQLLLKVNRTWNPLKENISRDYRELGIAVGEIQFYGEFPEDGVGFHQWEKWRPGQFPELPNMKNVPFRWTGGRASVRIEKISKFRSESELFLMCAHPKIGEKPVVVELLNDAGVVKKLHFNDHKWKKVKIQNDAFQHSNIITFQVSRTWNPLMAGISNDHRDLGVAVAIANKKMEKKI